MIRLILIAVLFYCVYQCEVRIGDLETNMEKLVGIENTNIELIEKMAKTIKANGLEIIE